MAKNVSVVDENGMEYTKTYPGRARGLVKKGRARYVSESVICLACPPYRMGDNRMNTIHIKEQTAGNTIDTSATDRLDTAVQQDGQFHKEAAVQPEETERIVTELAHMDPVPVKLDSAWLVQKIDQILADTGYLTSALGRLENLDKDGAAAACDMIAYRERTNQRMIEFLEKLMGKMAV